MTSESNRTTPRFDSIRFDRSSRDRFEKSTDPEIKAMKKALAENAVYLSVGKLNLKKATILSSTHEFTVDRKTGEVQKDDDHITFSAGKYTMHVYILLLL
jgi:hypothetical protein